MGEAVANVGSGVVLDFPKRKGTARGAQREDRADAVLTAAIHTSKREADCLLASVAAGQTEFLIVSVDGQLSLRAHVAFEPDVRARLTVHGRMTIDWVKSSISSGGNEVQLSRTELRLMEALVAAEGRFVTRDELIAHAWPNDGHSPGCRENALTVYVCGLRKRLAAIGLANVLETVRRAGYRLEAR